MTSEAHLLDIGETQSGKTYYANQLHQRFPRVSIFFNTNEVPYVWGQRIVAPSQLREGLKNGTTKFVYQPNQNLERADQQLAELREYLFAHAKPGTPIWGQVVVDEAQKFPETAEDLTRRALGRGVRVVCVTQYPTGLPPGLRTNCPNRIVFKPGIEGLKFLRDYGYYPHEEIEAHTSRRYHFASYSPDRGWAYHAPV